MKCRAFVGCVTTIRFKFRGQTHGPGNDRLAIKVWLLGIVAFSLGCSGAEQSLKERPANKVAAEEPKDIDEAGMGAPSQTANAASSVGQKVKLQLSVEETDFPGSSLRIGNPLKSYFAKIDLYNGEDDTIRVRTGYFREEVWVRVRNEVGALVHRTSNAKLEMRPDPESGGVDAIWQDAGDHYVSIDPGESLTWSKNISACFHIDTGKHSAQAFVDIGWMEGEDRSRGATIESNVVEFSVSEVK